MKVISFFSGAGGFDLGFALAGHEIVWSNDFDNDANKTYNENIGKYFNHQSISGDIVKHLDFDENELNQILPSCDIIIGGFPCQGFTIANLNRSMQDDRNYLYLQLLKAISVKQPSYFMLENVKGLESMEQGQVLKMIMDDLEKAGTSESKFFPKANGQGYTVFYNVANALNYGVPENRERVIIFGIRNDQLDTKKFQFLTTEIKNKKSDPRKILELFYTHDKSATTNQKQTPNQIVNDLYNNFKNGNVNRNLSLLNEKRPLYKLRNLKDAIADLPLEFDESINNHTGSLCKIKFNNKVGNRETFWDKHAPTIMGRGSGTGGPLIPPHPSKERRLSVREVARIQTFPDDFIFYGSNSSAYRQIGNAVPVLMAFNLADIFNRLLALDLVSQQSI